MARIRTIKPEFFTSSDIIELTPLARLFYISLWCEADREGRLSWNRKTLRFRYFPSETEKSFNAAVDELIASELVNLYKVDSREYCEIPSFLDHQSINNRESESKIPPKDDDSETFCDASVTRESGVQGERKGKEGKGREGKGTREKRETTIPDDFSVTQEMSDWYSKQSDLFLNITDTTDRWIDAMKSKGYKYKDWSAAWRNGMKKAHDWHKQNSPGQQQQAPRRNGFDTGFEK